jgi:hypothetical protein
MLYLICSNYETEVRAVATTYEELVRSMLELLNSSSLGGWDDEESWDVVQRDGPDESWTIPDYLNL